MNKNKPKYKINDEVSFEFEGKIYIGKIHIVDTFGTFTQHDEPSYDVMVDDWYDGKQCLVKHIRESLLLNNKND